MSKNTEQIIKVLSLDDFERDIRERYPKGAPAMPKEVEDWLVMELALVNHFVQHALIGVTEQLAKMDQNIQRAIEGVKFPNRSIQ